MRQALATPAIEFDLEPAAMELGPAREKLRTWLRSIGLDRETEDELVVVAVELWSNAIEATPRGGDPVHFVARVDGTSVHLEVSNEARVDGWSGEFTPPTDPMRDRGRGLSIVDALTDTMTVVSGRERTVVRCTRVLPALNAS